MQIIETILTRVRLLNSISSGWKSVKIKVFLSFLKARYNDMAEWLRAPRVGRLIYTL